MQNFVDRNSVVRRIWGDGDMVLLVFAGSAAEFALNRAVGWLFFTGKLPGDPIGRLFSTAAYAQHIVFADEATASQTMARIRAVHQAVEQQRGQRIPDWAHRDVLYMLIDYSERAHEILARPLTPDEQHELYDVFYRVGAGLGVQDLPLDYGAWKIDRERHLRRDLSRSAGTHDLYSRFRDHLGPWRHHLLLQIQSILTPQHVRELLQLKRAAWLVPLLRSYPPLRKAGFRSIIQRLLMPSKYLAQVRSLDYNTKPIEVQTRMAERLRRVKAATVLSLALAVGGADPVGAQGKDLFGAGAAFLGLGASRIGTGELDDRLEASGYPTFGRSATGVNAGAHLVLPGGLTVGGEWHGIIIGEKVHQGRDVGIGGGYGTLGLGYMMELSQRLRVYPRLGLGAGGMGLWVQSDSVVGFDEVLANPQPEELRREPVLSTGSGVIDLGLGAEFLPGGVGRGLMLGVRLGYLRAFDTDWSFHDRTVSDGPGANLGGPYIRATIGVGWRR